MDEAQGLEAIANILGEISSKPLDLGLHLRHIELAKTLNDLESQLTAFQMVSEFLAVGDEVWLPYLDAKAKSVDLETEEDVQELLQLYEKAEADYLSIPILQKHLDFVVEQHAKYEGDERQSKPETLGDLFSTDWTREAISRIVARGTDHITESNVLFDVQRDWELAQLERATADEAAMVKEHVGEILQLRLKQPHRNSDETFQAYSTFTTKYRSPSEYESVMVTASKTRGGVVKGYERREPLEAALKQTHNSLEAFSTYITYERRAKNPDLLATRGVYERTIAEAAKRLFAQEPGADIALATFWGGYLDAMRLLDVGVDVEGDLFRRALRSVPGSGEVWARYIRFLERALESMVSSELEDVAGAYNRALAPELLQKDMEQLIPVTLAYGSHVMRGIKPEEDFDQDAFAAMIGAVEGAIDSIRKASKEGDTRFRLEKFLVGVYEALELNESAVEVWKAAAKKCRTSYGVWVNYTDLLIRQHDYPTAREVFDDVHKKKLDWPEAVWEAWISFEQLKGTVHTIDIALDKIEKARIQVNYHRARAAQEAYEAQASATAPTQPIDTSSAMVVDSQPATETQNEAMDVDNVHPAESKKRSADDEEQHREAGTKKARFEEKAPNLKRDRENTTVFVADLPASAAEDDLKVLFKDCGRIREVKITQLPGSFVALVEFFDRDSIPAALTKDKKRIHDQELSVHLAWKSTLYVTNFPESADDTFIKNLFGKYGTLFDVRWPSKKFKTTRRFCYVQFTSPTAAESALELHGHELEPDLLLNVYISNPERKKERTDHDANEREVYVAGLSKFTAKEDLQKLFSTYGKVKEVRLATERDGHARGYAFIEYEEPQDARRALDANNHELKKRRIAVTLSDPRVRARHKSETGLGRNAEMRSRSVRVKNVPVGTQEGLLQQAFEKIAAIRRVELFADKWEAVVELESAAEAGKLLLRTEPILFNGQTLVLSEEGKEGSARNAAPPPKTGGLFVPRKTAGSRPRAGLGIARKPPAPPPVSSTSAASSSSQSANRGQDDFRKMLQVLPLCFIHTLLHRMDADSEYQETTSVTLEWTLRGLKLLFDSTKGDSKSKVTRSPRFGNGRWQILFYANAGSQKDGGEGYVSLYLSCEPTPSEKEVALADNGRWHREGTYKFCFELRDVEKKILYNVKEAVNHSFSYKTANWGWAQFARRDSIYYQSPNVKAQDAFVIVCTVVSTPVTPSPPSQVARYSIPRPLLDTIGSLLDDPLYSDVQFIVGRQGPKSARRIWASKKILSRAEYFATMFNSNFAEGLSTISHVNLETPRQSNLSLLSPSGSTASSTLNVMDEFEDSDDEDDDVLETRLTFGDGDATSSVSTEELSMILAADTHVVEPEYVNDEVLPPSDSSSSSPISPAETATSKATDEGQIDDAGGKPTNFPGKPPPMTVMVTDVAYSTYKAILYYIYTDVIVFAPLSSSFSNVKTRTPPRTPLIRQNSTASESSSGYLGPKRSNGDPPTSRAEWIVEWMKDNPGRPAPCSAKAVYRIADKLDLGDLKDRATKHLFKSLTTNNIAYEVFSPFAAVFEEIRKVEMEFFLNNWHEIRASESMRTVWQQIRSGRHPGFEEVWPLIAQSLEFKPSAQPQQASTKSTGAAQSQ